MLHSPGTDHYWESCTSAQYEAYPTAVETLKRIHELQPDLIHHHFPFGGFLIPELEGKFPIIGTPHGWHTGNSPVTKMDKDWVYPIVGNHENLIRLGVDLNYFNNWLPKQHGEILSVAVVGRLSPEKIPESFLQWLETRPLPANVRLRFYGGGVSHERFEIEERLKKLGHRVETIDPDSVCGIYRYSDALLIPSQRDASPYVALEAMACGLPVVARRTEGLPDTLGNAGMFFDSHSELPNLLGQLVNNVQLRIEQSNKSRARACEKYDIRRMLAEYNEAYSKVTNGVVCEDAKFTPKKIKQEEPIEIKEATEGIRMLDYSGGGLWWNPCWQRTVVSTGSQIGRHTQIGIDIGTFDGTIDNVNYGVDLCPEVQDDWADRVQFGINFFASQYRHSIPRLVFPYLPMGGHPALIPPNATIRSAAIRLRALPKPEGLIFDNYNNVPVTVRIFVTGDKVPHMPDQWTHEMCINPRLHNAPMREWEVGGWSDDRWVTTPDLSTIIQEWIDNPPIAPGDAFGILRYFNVYFFICDFESTPVMYRAYDYSDDPASAPILDVWYTLTHTESMDGGCVVGGDTWKLYAEHTEEMTGGVVVGGESWELYGEFVQPMEGGVVLSGEWKLFGDHVYPMEGGVVLGGDTCPLITAPRTLTYPMLGKMVSGGAVSIQISGRHIASGTLQFTGFNILKPSWRAKGRISVGGSSRSVTRLAVSAILSEESIAQPSLYYSIRPIAIVSTYGVGIPDIDLTVFPESIASHEEFGIPNVPITLRMVGHSSQCLFGWFRITRAYSGFGGIASQESFGIPVVTFGSNYRFMASGSITLRGGRLNILAFEGVGSIRVRFETQPPIFVPFYLSDWLYCRTIRIQHTYVDASMSRFPTLVKIVDDHIGQAALPNGADLRFAGSGEDRWSLLPHELESFEIIDGVAYLEAWVGLDYDVSRSETVIYLYYGNPLANDSQNPEGIWVNDFSLVDHMQASLVRA